MMAEVYGKDIPWIYRLLGVWAIQNKTMRANWFEWSPGWGFHIQYQTGHCGHESRRPSLHLHIIYGNLFLKLPWVHFYDGDGYAGKNWGVYWYGPSLNFDWGKKHKCFYAPWCWEQVRHEVVLPDGSLAPYAASWRNEEPDGRHIEIHDFTYTRLSGEVQRRKATIFSEEREYRWRCFRWLPYPRNVERFIEISFDDEVGEESGSWKGGVIGCSEKMQLGETPLDTLRRSERGRDF